MINIKNICKYFNEKNTNTFHALKNINLNINTSECIILSGISGSGKTTLLSIIGSLMKPSSGAVEIDGENIVSLSDFHASKYRNTKVGFITQSFNLFDELSVEENIQIPLIVTSLTNKEVEKRVSKSMQISNIFHKAKQKVRTLSGGERQRCMIARALVNKPDIILCDEPTANLDISNTKKFIDIIVKLKEMKKTIIIATHDPIFSKLKCVDKVIYLKDGSLE